MQVKIRIECNVTFLLLPSENKGIVLVKNSFVYLPDQFNTFYPPRTAMMLYLNTPYYSLELGAVQKQDFLNSNYNDDKN